MLASLFRAFAVSSAFAFLMCSSGCQGGYDTPEAQARWDAYWHDDDRAQTLMRERRLDEAAAMYADLWRQAIEPALPGSPSAFCVAQDMKGWRQFYPELAAKWQALLADAEARVAAESVTTRDVSQFVFLVSAIGDSEPLERQVEALKGNDRKASAWRSDRCTSEEAQELLKYRQRPDLARLVQRNAGQRIGDFAGDVASGAAGLVVAPILGPGLAPR